MADRQIEGRDVEVLKARPLKVGVERVHTYERIRGYSLRAPQDYRLDANRTMQFRSV